MTATSEPGISQPTVLFQAFMSMQSVQDRSFPRTCTWARVLLDMSYIQCYFYRSKTNYVLSKVSYQMIHFAIKNYTGRTRTQSLWCPRARLTLKAEVRTLSNIRGTRLSHHEKGPSVRTWPGKTPIAWKENVVAWLRLCANQALCHYQECASDRQRAMSLVWLLHGDCNGPFLLFGVWLAKMDFVHLPVRLSARGSVWIESPSRTLKGSGGASAGRGVVCVPETLWTGLKPAGDTITSMCAQQPTDCFPARGGPSQGRTRGHVFILFILEMQISVCWGDFSKGTSKFLACVQSGYFFSLHAFISNSPKCLSPLILWHFLCTRTWSQRQQFVFPESLGCADP